MLPNRIANDADEGSQRKILIDCVVQVEEHRDGCTGTTKSNALQRGTPLWLPRRPLFATHCGGNNEFGRPLLRRAGAHDMDGRYDDERGQAMSSTRLH